MRRERDDSELYCSYELREKNASQRDGQYQSSAVAADIAKYAAR